jgi:hypothetical protein
MISSASPAEGLSSEKSAYTFNNSDILVIGLFQITLNLFAKYNPDIKHGTYVTYSD